MTTAPSLFDGPVYEPEVDNERLTGQLGRVWFLMRDERWRTLDAISEATGAPHASVSAQLRHLRKTRFGAHLVDKRSVPDSPGLYEYRLRPQGPLLDGVNRRKDPPAVPCPTCGSGRLRPREDAVIAAARALSDHMAEIHLGPGETIIDYRRAEADLATALAFRLIELDQ